MKNVVMVQPGIGDMDMFRDNPTPPMGLLCAASLVSREAEVRVVDQRVDRGWRSSLASALDGDTVAVGVTTMTGGMINGALAAARRVRELSPAPIVWGGVHPSLLPEQTAAHVLADFVVQGEGEEAFAELVRRLASGADTSGIPGVWSGRGGAPAGTPRSSLLDLNSLPRPPYHLVDMEKYVQTYRGRRMFFYQSSRGCPSRCAYCYNRVFSLGRWRARRAELVLEDVRALKEKYDFSLLYFLDDNFFIDMPRAMRILEGLRGLGVGASLQGVDIDTLARMTDADLDRLEACGVVRMAIGVESGVDRVRWNVLEKTGSLALAREQLARFKGRKISVMCSLLTGLPTESREEMLNTIGFALEILDMGRNFRIPQFFIFSPYPGTALFSALQKGGTVFPSRLEAWGNYEWDHSHMHESSPETRDFLERAVFLSKFLDRKMDDYASVSGTLKLLYDIYRPVARARLRRGILRPLPERWCYRQLKKAFGRRGPSGVLSRGQGGE